MIWKTFDLNKVLNGDSFKKIQEFANVNNLTIDDIVESEQINFSLYEMPITMESYNPKFDAEKNIITFSKSIKDLKNIVFIRSETSQEWIYYPTNPYLGGTISEDGLTLHLMEQKYYSASKSTDKIGGSAKKLVDLDEYQQLRRGFEYPNLPREWTKPILVLDLNQVFDNKTYDGSFPVWISPASILYKVSKEKADSNLLWCFIEDAIFSKNIKTQNGDTQKYTNEIAVLKKELEISINKINQIKQIIS